MQRTKFGIAAILVLAAGRCLAQDAASSAAPPSTPLHLPPVVAADGTPRGVIEDSYVVAAKRLPGASLDQLRNYADDGDLAAGVSLRYRIDKAPWIVADLFVYPAGEGPVDAMLERASKEFLESVDYAQAKGAYSNIWQGSQEPYGIALAGGGSLPGRFLPMTFDSGEDMLASRTYLFYRKLYFYKVRMTTNVEAVESLSDLADGFTRDVVNGVDVVSTGTCGRKFEVEVLPHDQSPPAGYDEGVSADGFHLLMRLPGPEAHEAAYGLQLSQRLELAGKRQRALGCTSLDFTPPVEDADRAVARLHFGRGDWGAAPRP
jgi:hypothetical protein